MRLMSITLRSRGQCLYCFDHIVVCQHAIHEVIQGQRWLEKMPQRWHTNGAIPCLAAQVLHDRQQVAVETGCLGATTRSQTLETLDGVRPQVALTRRRARLRCWQHPLCLSRQQEEQPIGQTRQLVVVCCGTE